MGLLATSTLTALDVGAAAVSGSDLNDAVFANGLLHFLGSSDGSFGQMRLQASDGAALLTPVTGPALRDPFGFPGELIVAGGEVLFTATEAATGFRRIFQLNDDGATAEALAAPTGIGNVWALADLGGGAVGFVATDGFSGIEQIFRFTVGSQPGLETFPVQQTVFLSAAPMGDLTTGGDGELYFTRTEAATGRELWILDGTQPEGARLLQDIKLSPAPVSHFPEQLVLVPPFMF